MNIETIKSVYFIGAGGIGMSALVRYFLHLDKFVAGYDKTPSALTEALISEGANIHYKDSVQVIPNDCLDKSNTLIVLTPAIPKEHTELCYFQEKGFTIMKRAQVLGIITQASKGLCVAGTHGKTTTSSMLAHLLHESTIECTAFLGGITKNYGTNLLLSSKSPFTVIEADEFDRSFHWLSPYMSVITSTDADHLDIYGTKEAYMESFEHYTELIQPGGVLLIRKGIELQPKTNSEVNVYTYARSEGDFHAENERIGNGEIIIDFVGPNIRINDIKLGVPVSINIENGVAAMAIATLNGVTPQEIKTGMESFKGVDRRFDFKIKQNNIVLLSDYAHHPAEIAQSIRSIREIYPDKRISTIFQPHLYTRTRDFYADFAKSLSLADEVILTDIYPARELPIPGVSSQLIFNLLSPAVKKYMYAKEDIIEHFKTHDTEVLIVLGAGNIIDMVPAIQQVLLEKYN